MHDTSIKALGKHEKVWTQESYEGAGARPKPERECRLRV